MSAHHRHEGEVDTTSPRERRKHNIFIVLAGIFLGNALLAELIGGKLFQVPTPVHLEGGEPFKFTLSCGIILWPVVFVISDIINEYFGRAGVKRLSILGSIIIAYAFVVLWVCQFVKSPSFSPVDDQSFRQVFLQSQWIIVGSITAFLLGQLIDVSVFWLVRRRTGHRHLWLRATGSTLVSQLIDTFVVQFIGLYLPWRLGYTRGASDFTFAIFLNSASSGYLFKVIVAIGVTPMLYIVHAIIDRYLGRDEAHLMIEATAKTEHAQDSIH